MRQLPLLFLALCVSLFVTHAGAASFTMEVSNASTGGFIALGSDNIVYRGDNVSFTDTTAGATSWKWSFGDGYFSTVQNPYHQYTFGKRPILMKDGCVLLTATLDATVGGGTSSHSEIINFTTPLPRLITQVATIALMDENLSENYTAALTGNRSAPAGWAGFDWLGGLTTTGEAYSGVLGNTIFLILVFSIPFIMNWIITKDFIVSGVLGGFLGIFIIVRLPAQMQLIAVAFIIMSIVAVIYSLLKERI